MTFEELRDRFWWLGPDDLLVLKGPNILGGVVPLRRLRQSMTFDDGE